MPPSRAAPKTRLLGCDQRRPLRRGSAIEHSETVNGALMKATLTGVTKRNADRARAGLDQAGRLRCRQAGEGNVVVEQPNRNPGALLRRLAVRQAP